MHELFCQAVKKRVEIKGIVKQRIALDLLIVPCCDGQGGGETVLEPMNICYRQSFFYYSFEKKCDLQ